MSDGRPEKDGTTQRRSFFGRLTPGSTTNFLDTLRAENTGAAFLLAGAVIAIVWANSPWSGSYHALSEWEIGPEAAHLRLSLAEWAKDGLLTIFFFVVGLELKREMVTGQLRRFSTAIVPVVAAVGGMAAPALIYTIINTLSSHGSYHGWAVPVATDIAFAVAVLSAFGSKLPTALRAFLLTLAVADDLLGIVVIAVFYSSGLAPLWLLGSFAAVAGYAVLVRVRNPPVIVLGLLAVLAWYCMHASGVHATIAGVLIGFATPALELANQKHPRSLAEHYEHVWRPISAGLAVPLFAFFAAGVSLAPSDLANAATDPVAQGVVAGLVLGKPLGIIAATALLVTLTKAQLDDTVRWPDLTAVACVGGIGFTVSLLIGELAYPADSPHEGALKAAILIGSLTSAIIGAVLLSVRSRKVVVTADEG
ncbi:MAG: Na+/H+ antiporter NhaA [Propionibacteriaceae bacterium]|jgi:NhaA family Na+:H+ antiporter|nr:Na+/H+ antiporter NhaA [Propionibacteriaceae bacterium]